MEPHAPLWARRLQCVPLSDIERVDCIFCGPSPTRRLRLLRIESPEGDLLLRRCLGCGLVFQSPRYTQEKLAELLSRDYFEGGGYAGDHHTRSYFDPAERQEKVAFSHERLAEIEALRPSRGRLLEVGAAGGHFLLAARDRGWSVEGVELSEYAAARARDLYGLDLHRGQLEKCAFPAASFDVVYLNDLLEHVPRPPAFLEEVRRVLRPDGILFAVVPTYVRSLPTRLFAPVHGARRACRRLLGRQPGPTFLSEPFHIYEFTPATLRLLCERARYDVIAMTSSMPSLQSGARSTLSGFQAGTKLALLRLYSAGVRRGIFWGERTTLVARPHARS